MLHSSLGLLNLSDRVYTMGDHMWNNGYWFASPYHMGVFGYGSWLFSGVLLLAAVAVLVIVLAGSKKRKNSDLLETLKQRFVNGEITEEEYLSKKAVVLRK